MTNDDSSAAGLGMFARLKAGLARTTTQLSGGLTGIFTKERLDAETVRVLEDALIRADIGTALAHDLDAEVAKDRYDTAITEMELRQLLAATIAKVLEPAAKPFVVDPSRKPFVVLVAGVNGTGKTTTIGKLASKLNDSGHRVWLAAGDTFRAAAIEQLKVWGERTKSPVIAMRSAFRRLTRPTMRSTKPRLMVEPTCKSLICAIFMPANASGNWGSLIVSSRISSSWRAISPA